MGNPCLVYIAETAPTTPPAPAAITQCITWAQEPLRAAVRCWTPTGVEIQLCGHGLLCCANVWQSYWNSPCVLEMNGMKAHCDNREGIGWVSLPTLQTRHCAVPDWAAGLLGGTPVHAALAGSEDGYLVLAMPGDCDLATLTAPAEQLECHTRRSLIVTRRVSAQISLRGETIQYRYFAPQHGVPEDTATGSAMRVLAAYWQQRSGDKRLLALQRSSGGGWLQSRIDNAHTWIGGHVIKDER